VIRSIPRDIPQLRELLNFAKAITSSKNDAVADNPAQRLTKPTDAVKRLLYGKD
jgi:hypothetical protein